MGPERPEKLEEPAETRGLQAQLLVPRPVPSALPDFLGAPAASVSVSAARSAAVERSLRAFESGGSAHMSDGRPRHRADIRDQAGQYCTVLFAARGHLQARPWWTPSPEVAAQAVAALPDVRREVSALLVADGMPATRHGMGLGVHAGWLTKDLLRDGIWIRRNCERCPDTVAFLKSLPGLCECSLARAYFSILTAGKDISPHHGRSNVKLRMQLPLILGAEGYCEMTVGGETRRYADDGTLLLFDDSFLHEVHNRSSTDRVVLLCDLWHPDLSEEDTRRISDTFSPPSVAARAALRLRWYLNRLVRLLCCRWSCNCTRRQLNIRSEVVANADAVQA